MVFETLPVPAKLLPGDVPRTAPALFASSLLLRGNSPQSFHARLRSILLAVQIGLAMILLAGGATLSQAFLKMMAADTGFQTGNIVSLRVSLAGGRYEDDTKDHQIEYSHQVLARIRRLDGVVSASASQFLPLGTHGYMGNHFKIDHSGPDFIARNIPVTPGFFETMAATFIAGRDLRESPGEGEVVVSESFVRKFMDDPRTAVGRNLSDGRKWSRRIVGVVRDMSFNGPAFVEPQMQIFPSPPVPRCLWCESPAMQANVWRHCATRSSPSIGKFQCTTS